MGADVVLFSVPRSERALPETSGDDRRVVHDVETLGDSYVPQGLLCRNFTLVKEGPSFSHKGVL